MKRLAGYLAPRAYTLNDSCCYNKKERKKEKWHPTNPCFPTPLWGEGPKRVGAHSGGNRVEGPVPKPASVS